jgi:tRNA(fMet)-specific endonuclease VapC
MRYLLDTDWIINLLAGEISTAQYVERLNPDEIGISLISVAEVSESAFHYANSEAHIATFRTFLNNFQVLNFNMLIMEKFAEVRAYLRRRGQLVPDFDILLGSTTLHYDLTVLTYNRKHFTRIPDLKIYQS